MGYRLFDTAQMYGHRQQRSFNVKLLQKEKIKKWESCIYGHTAKSKKSHSAYGLAKLVKNPLG